MDVKSHSHEIIVEASLKDVFSAIENIDTWTRFMPAVIESRSIDRSGSEELIEITAEMNETKRTWRSKRYICHDESYITFEQLDLKKPLLKMEGKWMFEDHDNGVLVILTHNFSASDKESSAYISRSIKNNASTDLRGLKEFVEGSIL